jgi:hypothetical protein
MNRLKCKRLAPIAECMLLTAILLSPSVAVVARPSAPAPSASAKTHELTTDEMIDRLRAEKVVSSGSSLKIDREPEELVVTTEKDPKFNDEQLKVQAVLLAKSALDFSPKLMRTKIVFTEDSKPACQLVIKRIELVAYATGKVDKNELLLSLDMTKGSGSSASAAGASSDIQNRPDVVPGAFQKERREALMEIGMLKGQGANTAQIEKLFEEDEAALRSGDEAAVSKNLPTIMNAIGTQREMLQAARQTGRSNGSLRPGVSKNGQPSKFAHSAFESFAERGTAVHAAIQILEQNHVDVSMEKDMLRNMQPGVVPYLYKKLRQLPPAATQDFFAAHPKFGKTWNTGAQSGAMSDVSSNGGGWNGPMGQKMFQRLKSGN